MQQQFIVFPSRAVSALRNFLTRTKLEKGQVNVSQEVVLAMSRSDFVLGEIV